MGNPIFVAIALALATTYMVRGGPTGATKPLNKRRAFVLKIWESANNLAQAAGWPRDLIITVAGHESNWGTSGLTLKGNNLFGFKSSPNWIRDGGKIVKMQTWEVIRGKNIQVMADFRAYDNWEDSIKDYIRLVTTRSRYSAAAAAAKAGDLKKYFQEIKKGGYATDPKYPDKLARVYGEVEEITS